MDYILETNEKGKQVPKKVGLAPIMRDGVEYEFTTVLDLDMHHQALVSKDRTGLFSDELFLITEEIGERFLKWLDHRVKEKKDFLEAEIMNHNGR